MLDQFRNSLNRLPRRWKSLILVAFDAVALIGVLWFVNLTNFMDGLDWITVADIVPVSATLAVLGALRALPPDGMVKHSISSPMKSAAFSSCARRSDSFSTRRSPHGSSGPLHCRGRICRFPRSSAGPQSASLFQPSSSFTQASAHSV